ncbi:MAG: hypothetical protein F4Y41_19200, partial [Gammaproteobacteria bacterium]|nr:hypothetical protein [Gammaproteobacteria bacterium]
GGGGGCRRPPPGPRPPGGGAPPPPAPPPPPPYNPAPAGGYGGATPVDTTRVLSSPEFVQPLVWVRLPRSRWLPPGIDLPVAGD